MKVLIEWIRRFIRWPESKSEWNESRTDRRRRIARAEGAKLHQRHGGDRILLIMPTKLWGNNDGWSVHAAPLWPHKTGEADGVISVFQSTSLRDCDAFIGGYRKACADAGDAEIPETELKDFWKGGRQ